MKGNPICWFEIYVEDMERAKRFYESVFKVTLEKLENPELEMWHFPEDMTQYGITGSLVKMAGFSAGGNSTLIYFSCEDCAVEADRVSKAGGNIMRTKFPIGQYGFIALAVDSEGNMIGLHSRQ